MKKIIYPFIIAIAMLSGCAKVTQEAIPCGNNRPATPIVPNTVAPAGYTYNISTQNYTYGSQVLFRGPNNFSLTSTSGELYLDFSYSTNYGMYTATAFVNGCASNIDTFYVESSLTGNPPCTISPSNYNVLTCSNSSSFQFSAGTLLGYQSNYCSGYSSGDDINATSTNGNFVLDINIPQSTTTGTYCQLINGCGISNGQAFVTISNSLYYTIVYESTGGYVYFNTIGGQKYATFCGATFTSVSGGGTVTFSGNVQYY